MKNIKIALIEPNISQNQLSFRSYADKSEPTHLIGIYNLILNAGINIEIIDAYSNRFSESDLIDKIISEKFTHVGFTVYDYQPSTDYIINLKKLLPPEIVTFVGGPGPTYSTDRIVNLIKPHFLIKGDGEKSLLKLATTEFDKKKLVMEQKQDGIITIDLSDKCMIIESSPMKLDNIPYDRPYSLNAYNFEASPRFQRGCKGKCIFCSGAYQKVIDYVSPDKAIEVLEYLIHQKRAITISPMGPDFTLSEKCANGIIKKIVNNSITIKKFRPGVRLDTLYSCINKNPQLWKTFSKETNIAFESSIESFAYSRMNRLGKNVSKKFLQNIFRNLDVIFKNCDCSMVLGRIALDPQIQFDEFIKDSKLYIKLLKKYPDRITIGVSLMNQFTPIYGTPAMNQVNNNTWNNSEKFFDPLMNELSISLLTTLPFLKECYNADHTSDISNRNELFINILNNICNDAKKIKRC